MPTNPSIPRKVDLLVAGSQVTVNSGEFKGRLARVVNKEVGVDRKILVDVDGERVRILPRMLDVAAWTPTVSPANPTVPAVAVSSQVGAPASPVVAPTPAFSGQLPDVIHADHPMLDPYRPQVTFAKDYINRVMENGEKDVDYLIRFFNRRDDDGYPTNVMLVGDTQSGKTMMIHMLSFLMQAKLGLNKPVPVFTLSGSAGVTDFDLFGQPTAYTDEFGVERLVWLPGIVDLAARVQGGALLYLDEVNMMAERVTSSLHSLCDWRRTFVNRMKPVPVPGGGFLPEQVVASDDLWIVGTINPGYKGAGALQEAFANRWQWIEWGYDKDVEDKLVDLSSVRILGDALREARRSRVLSTPIGTSALQQVCRNAREFGAESALAMLRAMFQPTERERYDTIVNDRSIAMLLSDEVRADGLHA